MEKECRLCGRELDPSNPNVICSLCVEKLTDSIALPYYYNVEEARIILRLESQEQVRRLIRQGRIPAIRKGRGYLFPKDDFDAWVKSGEPALIRKETKKTRDVTAVSSETRRKRAELVGTTNKAYEETTHKQKMRELARELQSAITLPWIIDSFLFELKPGRFLLGREGFPISISRNRTILVQSDLEGEGEVGYLRQGLRSHLQTGGFSSILDEIRLWKKGVADNLFACQRLIKTLRRKLERTFKTPIPTEYRAQPGFTLWFPVTVLADAVEQVRGSMHFKGFPYKIEGSELSFGAWVIYRGVEDQDLKLYEDAHKAMRSRCTSWQLTKRVAQQRQKLYQTEARIKEQLGKFTDMERLPGQCELCYSHLQPVNNPKL